MNLGCEQLLSHEEGYWIKVYIPRRWMRFIEEYAEYRGYKDSESKERYILVELQSSIRDFIFAALDDMKKKRC